MLEVLSCVNWWVNSACFKKFTKLFEIRAQEGEGKRARRRNKKCDVFHALRCP